MKPINNKRKRAFALLLALAMCLGLLQTFAFADEGEGIFSAIADVIAETTGAGAADAAEAGNEPEPAAESHTHNYAWEPGTYVMPTCEAGYRMWNGTCACGATATEKEPIAAIDPHTFGDNLPACAVCGKFNPDYKAPAVCSHAWESLTVTVPATCVVDGYEDYINRCTLCGAEEVLLHRDFLAIGEHDYGDDHKCTVCGEVDPEYAKPDPETCNHDWSEWKYQATGASKKATCSEPGYYTERRVCSLCNAKDYQQVETPAAGHNYVDGVCTVCEAQEPAVEPEPHTHSWGAWVHQGTHSYAATCTTTGLDAYIRRCNVCGVQDTEKLTYVIPAKGHSYVNGVCTACGEADPDAPLPEPRFLVTCDNSVQRVNAGDTASWTVALANNGDTEIQAVMSSNVPVYALYNGAAIRPQQYINIQPGTVGVLTVNYTTSKDTLSAVDDVVLTFVDGNSGINDGITLRCVVDGVKTDPVDPDPVNPDPVDPDPVNPDPVDPDPVTPTPAPTPNPTPVTPAAPAPAPVAPAVTAPAATAPAALTAPAAEEELDEDETPTADPEDEEVDEPETPTAAPEEDLDDPATPLAAPEEELDEGATPLAAPGRTAWALLNLILMLCTGLASALLLLDPTGREYRNRSGILRLVSLVPAIVALVAFFLTEDLRLPMTLADRWTLLMVLIALVQLAVCVVAKKVQNNESDGPAAARA